MRREFGVAAFWLESVCFPSASEPKFIANIRDAKVDNSLKLGAVPLIDAERERQGIDSSINIRPGPAVRD